MSERLRANETARDRAIERVHPRRNAREEERDTVESRIYFR